MAESRREGFDASTELGEVWAPPKSPVERSGGQGRMVGLRLS